MRLKCCTQYASTFGKLSNGYRTLDDRFSFQPQACCSPWGHKESDTPKQLNIDMKIHIQSQFLTLFLLPLCSSLTASLENTKVQSTFQCSCCSEHFPRFLLDSPHTYTCPLPKDTVAENTISNSLPFSNLALLYFSLKCVFTWKICLSASFLLLQLECETRGGKEFVHRLPWWHPRRPVQHGGCIGDIAEETHNFKERMNSFAIWMLCLLMKVKEESEKAGLKRDIQNTKILVSITSWQIDGETMETVKDFIFLSSKITEEGDCSHEI